MSAMNGRGGGERERINIGGEVGGLEKESHEFCIQYRNY